MPKDCPNTPIYYQDKRRKKLPPAAIHGGSVRNHPLYGLDEPCDIYHFLSDGKVIGLVDPKNEDIYIVPEEDSEAHAVWSDGCLQHGVPYIDNSPDFQVAVPYKYYAQIAKSAGVMDHYEWAMGQGKALEAKWRKFKRNNLALQTH